MSMRIKANARCRLRVSSTRGMGGRRIGGGAVTCTMDGLSIEKLANGHVQFFARPTWALTLLASALSALLVGMFAVGIWLAVAFQIAFVLLSPLALVLELVVIYAVCFRNRYILVTERLVVLGLAEYDAGRVLDVDVEKGALLFRFDNRRVPFFKGLPKDELIIARDTIRDALNLAEMPRSA